MPFDDQQELFYWVDENDHVLGSMTRALSHDGTKKIHRCVYVVISDDQGNVLLQHRSQHKDQYPGYWTVSASGHVTYGQEYEEAIKREAKEELGVEINHMIEVDKVLIETPQEKEISMIFKTKMNDMNIDYDEIEVQEVKWVEPREIKKFFKEGILTPAAIKVLTILGYL